MIYFIVLTSVFNNASSSITSSWEGLYGGALFGGSFGHAGEGEGTWSYLGGPPADGTFDNTYLTEGSGSSFNGFSGNLKLGYSKQIDKNVLGAELGLTLQTDSTNGVAANYDVLAGHASDPLISNTKINTFETMSLRYGRLLNDHSMIYALGGVAFAQIRRQVTQLNSGRNDYWIEYGTSSSSARTTVGFSIGGGLEYKLSNQWSLRVDYQYLDFGSPSFHYNGLWSDNFTPGLPSAAVSGNQSNSVRFSNISGGIAFFF